MWKEYINREKAQDLKYVQEPQYYYEPLTISNYN